MNEEMSVHNGTHEVPQEKKPNAFWEIIKFAIIALVIVIPVRLFIAQPFIVSGDSMVPTFEDKDYVIVDEISYRFHEPNRGDVIIFRFPLEPDRFFIKRVIGLPGETVILQGQTIKIKNSEHPEGFEIDEPEIKVKSVGHTTITLKDDEFFVMGDNRNNSSDSRSWGPLEEKYIIGRALIRLLPVKHLDVLPGNYKTYHESNDSK